MECRVSKRPAVLTNVTDRPKLYRNPTAIHFLFTEPPKWNEVEDDGFEYQTTGLTFPWGQGPSWCTGNSRLVNIITLDQMRIIMRETAKNTSYWVNLTRKPGGQPTWDAGGAAIPYNQTDLDPASLVDQIYPSWSSYFYLTHNGSHYTFTGTFSPFVLYSTICQDNLLNLVLFVEMLGHLDEEKQGELSALLGKYENMFGVVLTQTHVISQLRAANKTKGFTLSTISGNVLLKTGPVKEFGYLVQHATDPLVTT
nr:uncharacterized protein LOC123762390 [Procambarus clarkii]